MYRTPTPPAQSETPPPELHYVAIDRSRRGNSATASFKLFALPILVGIAVLVVGTPELSLAAMIASAVGSVVWWRRAPTAGSVVLRVDDGVLRVLARGGRDALALGDDDDARRLHGRPHGGVDEAKVGDHRAPLLHALFALAVELYVDVGERSAQRVPLTEERVPHMDAAEQYGKIRVFLRKHGWLPRDERAGEGEDDDE